MTEVKRYYWNADDIDGLGYGSLDLLADASSQELVSGSDFDRVTAERDALQQRLTAADERVDQAETIIRKWKSIFGESMARRSELYVTTDAFLSELKPAEAYKPHFGDTLYSRNPVADGVIAWKFKEDGKWHEFPDAERPKKDKN